MEQLPGIHDDVHCIALSGARPKILYVATSRDPYRTDDEGDDWEVISGGVDGADTPCTSPRPQTTPTWFC